MNYVGVVKQFLHNSIYSNSSMSSIDSINSFLIKYTRGKYNTLTARGAMLQFCKWYGLKDQDIRNIIRLKEKGKKILYRKIKIQDIKSLITYFKPGVCKDVFIIQSATGCRSVEAWLINAEKGNIDFDDETNSARIQVIQKGGRTRVLHMAAELAEPIFNNPLYKDKKYPFLKDNCQNLTREEILRRHYSAIRRAYWRAWRNACSKAGLPQYSSHDARRAVIRAISEKYGVPMAQKIAGHVRIDTTMRYLDGSELDTLKAWREVWQ
jgi:integrase